MRRAVTLLSTAAAALLLVSAPALAAPKGPAHPAGHAAEHGVHHAKPAPKQRVVELNGVLSDTGTVTIAVPSDTSTATISDTSTATITLQVKGGDRRQHGQAVSLVVDSRTVVRRGDRAATLADLKPGDHVSVRARGLADGRWYALRVNAAPRH